MAKDTVKRRITKKDWDSVTEFINETLKTREGSKFRKTHEKIWAEVDRQVAMKSMEKSKRDKNEEIDWRNAVELGELSRASEIIAADVRRLSFPQNRAWFEAHSELPEELLGQIQDESQIPVIKNFVDGRVRAFMTQQHLDFGYKSRVDLSVKEALHHGSYVATVEWESAIKVTDGTAVKTVAAPTWKPHSMWNCFPDTIGPHNTFYQGSMIIKSYKPLYQVRRMVSPDPRYPFFNLDKVEQKTNRQKGSDDTEDAELITYYGDLVIPRKSGSDFLLLNSRATLANGLIIHYMPNPYPYPPIIYNGWERLDIRDPYHVSPIVKFSVDQKIGSILANRMLDAIDLKTEPPIIYDGTDPDFAQNGGPSIIPGSKTSSKSGAHYSAIDVGEPDAAFAGVQWITGQIEAGTRVDRVRSGVSPATEQTATEVIKQSQNAELSVVDFVDKHELHGLRPALYMMHDLNRNEVNRYSFFNQEMDAPDFDIMQKDELPENIHFEIVGSKGLLGEEQRQQQTSQVTAFWMGANPQLLNQQELAKEMYRDAGNKNPEKFLNAGDEQEAFQQQLQQVIQQAEAQIQELSNQLTEFQFKDEEHSLELEQKELEKEQLQTKIAVLTGLLRVETSEKRENRSNQ